MPKREAGEVPAPGGVDRARSGQQQRRDHGVLVASQVTVETQHHDLAGPGVTADADLGVVRMGVRDYLDKNQDLNRDTFVAAVAYIDPGNFATNIAGGAKYGFLLVWVILMANLTTEKHIHREFFESAEYRRIAELGKTLAGLLKEGAYVLKGDQRQEVSSLKQTIEWLLDQARPFTSLLVLEKQRHHARVQDLLAPADDWGRALGVAADHDREPALLQGHHAARHRGVQHGRAPLGDPITIIVNDYPLSLRLDEAETILLKA